MIEQIDEFFFNDFDKSEGEERVKEMDRLVIQYAHKIRELVNQVNVITEELEWKDKK